VTNLLRLAKLQRLYCDTPLELGADILLTDKQAHYLLHVLRMKTGDGVLVFNGRDGEWRAQLTSKSKKELWLRCISFEREQTVTARIIYCFAPLKAARLDYMVQKAVEMGTSCLQPVITDLTQNTRLNLARMRANVIEAAEQCGILSLPDCAEPVSLAALLEDWQPDHPLIFCDEVKAGSPSLSQLAKLAKNTPFGLLIGPEGGFSKKEREMLYQLSFVTPIGLGPRILRADTAAVAAMALVGATIGDWI